MSEAEAKKVEEAPKPKVKQDTVTVTLPVEVFPIQGAWVCKYGDVEIQGASLSSVKQQAKTLIVEAFKATAVKPEDEKKPKKKGK